MAPRIIISLFLFTFSLNTQAQDAKQIVRRSNKALLAIKNYTCNAHLDFDVPGLNIQQIDGSIFFKRPNKFRIKSKGIIFLPKQNPNQMLAILADTVGFLPVYIGKEEGLDVIQLVPLKENDIAAAKLFINEAGKIMQAEITSKENGTALVVNKYANAQIALPTSSTISFDVKKFKVPKMVSVELNAKSVAKTNSLKSRGSIAITYSNYVINKGLSDEVFQEK